MQRQQASQIAVRSASGELFRGAFVMATDRERDLAVLRVEAFDVPILQLGNSNDLKVGFDRNNKLAIYVKSRLTISPMCSMVMSARG